MSNFFKKLTGSLNIKGADSELFEEDNDESLVDNSKQEGEQPEEDIIKTDIEEDTENDEILTKTASWQEIGGKAQEESTTTNTESSSIEDEPIQEQTNEEEEQVDEETIVDTPDTSTEETFSSMAENENEIIVGENPPTMATLASTKVDSRKKSKRGLSRLSLNSKNGRTEDSSMEASEGQLAIDVYETSKEVIIKSTIAGVKPEDLDVGIEDNTVNIRGSRHNEEKVKGEDYFYQECYWGTFSRSIILPVEVDTDKANASLKDGILTISLPKIIKEKEKKIKILS